MCCAGGFLLKRRNVDRCAASRGSDGKKLAKNFRFTHSAEISRLLDLYSVDERWISRVFVVREFLVWMIFGAGE